MPKVFVYGTLKEGYPNHHYLKDNKIGKVTFLHEASTKDRYPLVTSPKEGYLPYLLDDKGKGYVSFSLPDLYSTTST